MVSSKLYWALPPLIIGGSYMVLNYLRFGSVTEFGHNYLPEFTRVTTGQFNWQYLPQNLYNLVRLPLWKDGIVEFFGANGNAFYIVIPIVIPMAAAWCFAAWKRTDLLRQLTLTVLVLLYVLILCLHRTLGGMQWGDRYLLDVLPWCFYGLMVQKPSGEGFVKFSAPFMVFGVVLTCLGTVYAYNVWF